MRITICASAVELLGVWLAASMVTPQAAVRFALEAPALTVSVGQQFHPRLVNLGDESAGIQVKWWDGSHVLVTQVMTLAAAADVEVLPPAFPPEAASSAPGLDAFVAPHPGVYRLEAVQVDAPDPPATNQTIHIAAVAEPSAEYGGVRALFAAGLNAGIADYLRAHGFAVTDMPAATDSVASVGAGQLIVIGDPRLDGGDLVAEYRRIWTAVGDGANLLLLSPPPPGVADFWPLPRNWSMPGGTADIFPPPPPRAPALGDAVPHPAALYAVLFPLASYPLGSGAPDVYALNGARLPQTTTPAIFGFRYGSGWVTVSSLPLREDFADANVRVYLMNLIEAAAAVRARNVPAASGLQWVMEHRLASLSAAPASPARVLAVWKTSTEDAAREPEPLLEPALSDGSDSTCITLPQAAGVGIEASLAGNAAVARVEIDAEQWPSSFILEASPDGGNWQSLPGPTPTAPGTAVWPVDMSSFTVRPRWFRLRITSTASDPAVGARSRETRRPPWRVCEVRLIP